MVFWVLVFIPKWQDISKTKRENTTPVSEIVDNKIYSKAPVIFVDHGSPARILENDMKVNVELEKLWKKIKDNIKWVIFVSAHNLSNNKTYISNIENIEILYDFSWFPDELYDIKYDVKWDLALSQRLHEDIAWSELTQSIRNDHGIWSILKRLFPQADKKISILTINMDLGAQDYYNIWKIIKKYREEWYLIITSWSILHNFWLFDRQATQPQEWAQQFNYDFLSKLQKKDFQDIVNYTNLKNVDMAFQTKDHYVPIIYAVGAVERDEKVEILSDEITIWSLSNNLVVFWDY